MVDFIYLKKKDLPIFSNTLFNKLYYFSIPFKIIFFLYLFFILSLIFL